MSLNAEDIIWYYHDYDGIKPKFNCGDFPNLPLIGAKGWINNNPILSLHQLGYPLEDKPEDKLLEEFVLDEKVDDPKLLIRICRA